MAHHIFQLESELQNIPEASPRSNRTQMPAETRLIFRLAAKLGAF
jgi:hypothetical protein